MARVKTAVQKIALPLQWLTITVLRLYRYAISPFLAPSCRFTPTCSEYAIDCIQRFGAVKGIWLSLQRITKCHPFHSGGYDPVPEEFCSKDKVTHQ